jgi:hypothetical protein
VFSLSEEMVRSEVSHLQKGKKMRERDIER